VTAADRRSALAVLATARAGMAKLTASQHPEEIAAEIIEVWQSVETALRSLMGGSTLSGQALIRELRTGELLSLEQAHLLLELQAVRARVDDTAYQPTHQDVETAREAYESLRSGLASEADAATAAAIAARPTSPSGGAATQRSARSGGAAPATVYVPPPREEDVRRRRGLLLGALVLILALILLGGGAYWYRSRSGALPADVKSAVELYQRGQPEAARAALRDAARAHPELALPHLYLGRISRSEGDFAAAGDELKKAVELEPRSIAALNELGAFFLARGTSFANEGRSDLATADYNAARRSYVRALQEDPSDSTASGFLGCALARLGRAGEAASWLARAGAGPWTACASASTSDSAARGE